MSIQIEFINSNQRSSVQIICLLALLYSSYSIYDINWSNYWWESDGQGVIMSNQMRHSGLWFTCIEDGSGQSCEGVEVFWVALPYGILFGRYMIYVALSCCLLGMICYYIGGNLTSFLCKQILSYDESQQIMKDNLKLRRIRKEITKPTTYYLFQATSIKYKIISIGKILHFLAFICFAVSNIWIARDIAVLYFTVQDFTQSDGLDKNGSSYVWSKAIYDGWIVMFVLFFSLVASCFVDNEDKGYGNEVLNDFSKYNRDRDLLDNNNYPVIHDHQPEFRMKSISQRTPRKADALSMDYV